MMTMKSKRIFNPVLILAVEVIVVGTTSSATFTVTNTNDDPGAGSLRWAIIQANQSAGRDCIEFDIGGLAPHVIQPTSPLPELTEEVEINGYSQPGSAPATDVSPAILSIVLDGSSSSGHLGLLSIDPGASACEIKGLVINNYDRNGIFIESGADGNVIAGNYIGTDRTGSAGRPNGECGVFIKSSNNRIGGTTPDARNVISGNGWQGVEIWGPDAANNQVLGNFIGTDASGISYLPNGGNGLSIIRAPDNLVGGTEPEARNVITNVTITSLGAVNNQVIGNYIGITASGDEPLNLYDGQGVIMDQASYTVVADNVISGHARGVSIWPGSSFNVVRDNYIGTDATGQLFIGNEWDGVTVMGTHNQIEGNVVAASQSNGIYLSRGWESDHEMPSDNLIADNIIGMSANEDERLPNGHGITINTAVNTSISGNLIAGNSYTGVTITNDLPWNPGVNLALGNRITQNVIYNNGGVGINLLPYGDPDGVTPNDPGDADNGPNHLMNYPVLTSAMTTPGKLIVKGRIDTPNPKAVRLEFFANLEPDDSGHGEGEIFLGTARPNAQGKFTAVLPSVAPGMWISATATDGAGNTSEFTENIEAKGPGKGK